MNPQIQDLLHKADESLQAAKLLSREEYYDFAASRAYYTMFYVAQAFLLRKGLTFSSHAAVIAAFGKEYAKTGLIDAKFHRHLIDAEDLRGTGDYGVGGSLTGNEAAQALAWAEEFLQIGQQQLL
jgi:uncharacterized protein (UPF0332 family)